MDICMYIRLVDLQLHVYYMCTYDYMCIHIHICTRINLYRCLYTLHYIHFHNKIEREPHTFTKYTCLQPTLNYQWCYFVLHF